MGIKEVVDLVNGVNKVYKMDPEISNYVFEQQKIVAKVKNYVEKSGDSDNVYLKNVMKAIEKIEFFKNSSQGVEGVATLKANLENYLEEIKAVNGNDNDGDESDCNCNATCKKCGINYHCSCHECNCKCNQ